MTAVPDPFNANPSLASVPPAIQYSSGADVEVADADTLYQYEGKNVAATVAQITSVAGLEINDQILRVDEYVNMVVECRVVSVNHKVNEKTGKLMRVHTLKAIDSMIKPWAATTP